MKKFFLLCFALGLTACGAPSQTSTDSDTPESAEAEAIKIGAISALTGDAAVYGTMTQNVANLVIEEINANGGINGKSLEVVWEDGKCTPNDASKAAQKLVNVDKVNVIFGGTCSGETLAASPITEKAKVILFSSVSTNPDITNAGDYVFRTAPSDSSQGAVLAKKVAEKYSTVAVIHEQTDYAVAVAKVFESEFPGEIIKESYLSTESDFKTRITKLKNSKAEAIVLIPQSPPKGQIILKQLQEQEVQLPMFLNEVMADVGGVKDYTEYLNATEPAVFASFVAPSGEDFESFVNSYETKYEIDLTFPPYAATTHDLILILAQVLGSVEDVTDTDAIRDALYKIQDFDGLYPGLSLDENGDSNIENSLFTFDGEQFNLIEE